MSLTQHGWEPELVFVRWQVGVWKVIDFEVITDKCLLRWVKGPRPDAGLFHWVRRSFVAPLTDMEVVGLMADNEIVP